MMVALLISSFTSNKQNGTTCISSSFDNTGSHWVDMSIRRIHLEGASRASLQIYCALRRAFTPNETLELLADNGLFTALELRCIVQVGYSVGYSSADDALLALCRLKLDCLTERPFFHRLLACRRACYLLRFINTSGESFINTHAKMERYRRFAQLLIARTVLVRNRQPASSVVHIHRS